MKKIPLIVVIVLVFVAQYYFVREVTREEALTGIAVSTAEALFRHGGFEEGMEYLETGHNYKEWLASGYAARVKILTSEYGEHLLLKAEKQTSPEAENTRALAKWYTTLANNY